MNQASRAAVAGRFDRLVVPLHQPLGVGEEPSFSASARPGEEDFGLDRPRAGWPLDLRAVLPERGRLGLERRAPPASRASAARATDAAFGPPTAGFWPNA